MIAAQGFWICVIFYSVCLQWWFFLWYWVYWIIVLLTAGWVISWIFEIRIFFLLTAVLFSRRRSRGVLPDGTQRTREGRD